MSMSRGSRCHDLYKQAFQLELIVFQNRDCHPRSGPMKTTPLHGATPRESARAHPYTSAHRARREHQRVSPKTPHPVRALARQSATSQFPLIQSGPSGLPLRHAIVTEGRDAEDGPVEQARADGVAE